MSMLEKTIDFVDGAFGKKKPHFQQTIYWLKQLEPNADEAMQIAAYSHDVERGFRPKGAKQFLIYDNPADLTKHQIDSANIMHDFLIREGGDEKTAARVRHLISKHEDGGDLEQNLLKDADSLSYFEVNAPRHIDWLDIIVPESEIREKFDYMLKRITSRKARQLAQPMYNRLLVMLDEKAANSKLSI